MGGTAALATAIRYPENYCRCVDISGGIGYTLCTDTLAKELDGERFKRSFPLVNSTVGSAKNVAGSRHDLMAILRRNIDRGMQMPEFRLACGSREFVRERIEKDAQLLKELGLNVIFD